MLSLVPPEVVLVDSCVRADAALESPFTRMFRDVYSVVTLINRRKLAVRTGKFSSSGMRAYVLLVVTFIRGVKLTVGARESLLAGVRSEM